MPRKCPPAQLPPKCLPIASARWSSRVRHPTWRPLPPTLQSLWYRAPEVILGLNWTPKIDVWSLGCVAIEVVIGFVPFQFASTALVLAAQ